MKSRILVKLALVVFAFGARADLPPEVMAPDSSAAVPDSAAAATDSLPVYRVSGVTVIATRAPLPRLLAPASVEVLEPDPGAPASSAAQAVSSSAGIVPGAYGGPGSILSLSLRGSSSTDILYMIDGLPQNSARDGGFDLNRLPAGVTRVEVLRGPGSGLWGANAASGVVNFITARPERDRPYSRIRYQDGSYDGRELEASLDRSLGGMARLSAAGSWIKTGGQRVNSDYDGVRYSLELGTSPGAMVPVAFRHSHYGSENGNPGALSWPTPYDRQKDGQDDYRLDLGYREDVRLSLSHSVSTRGILTSWDTTDNRTRTRQAEVNARRRLLSWLSASSGLAHYETEDRSTASGSSMMDRSSAFLSLQAELPHSVLAAAGLRYDRASAYPSQLSPNLGLSWNPVKPLSLHAGYGRSHRAPSLIDLRWPAEVYPPYMGFVYKLSGNPRLRPEQSEQLELGARWDSGILSASAAVFRRRTRDLIDWTHVEFVPPDTTHQYPENLGRAAASGADLAASVSPLAFLSAGAAYSYCRSAEDTAAGRVLPYRPLNSGSAWLRLGDLTVAGALKVGLRLEARYADRQVVRHASEWAGGVELPSHVVLGQTLSIVIRDARFYYAIENLNNAEYQTRYSYPMPRRSHAFGLVLELWD